MESKIGKTLKNLLYSVPIAVASFLPMNKADGQIKKINNSSNLFFSKYENNLPMKVERPNSLYIILQPEDFGLGLRYDRRFVNIPRIGFYSSLSKGRYKKEGLYSIKDHYKVALGGLIYLNEEKLEDGTNMQAFFSLGGSYHTYGERSYLEGIINEKIFKPLSFDLGIGMGFDNGFTAGFNFDFNKNEGTMFFGYNFGSKHKKRTK